MPPRPALVFLRARRGRQSCTRENIMANLVLLFLCLALGMILRKSGRLPDNAHSAFNAFVVHVSLPALTLSQIHNVSLQPALIYSVTMPWILFASGAAFFWCAARALRLGRSTTGALMLSGGLANTSFVGLPMIETFYGAPRMAIGILIDQLGTYLVLSTLGIAIAAIYSEGATSKGGVLKRIVTFPPLLALVIAIFLMPVEYPAWLVEVLQRLGGTLAPLALVSVGLQLRLSDVKGNGSPLAIGLAFKLLIAPFLLAVFYFEFLRATGDIIKVTVFEAAMGPQIGGAIVAIQHGLNPPLITLMVGIGITLSFLTLPAWWYALQML
jgi:predicted permease